jgi:predicted transglutaminase-like cysteine proteinase
MESMKATGGAAWTKTVEVTTEAAEKTKEIALKLNEDLKPVSEKVVSGAKKGWEIASETAKTTADVAVDVTTKAVHSITQVLSDDGNGKEEA